MRPLVTAISIAAAAAAAAGCGALKSAPGQDRDRAEAAEPPPYLHPDDPYFLPGEVFHWDVSFRNITGGRAVMGVGYPGVENGREVLILRSRIESTGVAAAVREVQDEVQTWIAMDTGAPILHRADIRSANPEAMIETEFGDAAFNIDVSRVGRSPRTYRQDLPERYDAHDIHSLLGALRAWDGAEGDEVVAYLLSGRRIFHVTVTHAGAEPMSSRALGGVDATRIEAIAWRLRTNLEVDPDRDPRKLRIWLAEDGTRAPVRVEADTGHGTVVVDLVAYDRPETRITAER